MQERDLGKEPLSVTELENLIDGRNYLEFLNPRNELYREMKMNTNPPSREQAIQLMAKNPNLIRRPIFRRGNRWVMGFNAEEVASLIK